MEGLTINTNAIERLAICARFPRKRDLFSQILVELGLSRVSVFAVHVNSQTANCIFALDTGIWPRTSAGTEEGGVSPKEQGLVWMAEAIADPLFGKTSLDALRQGQFGADLHAVVTPLSRAYAQVVIAASMPDETPLASGPRDAQQIVRLLAAAVSDLVLVEMLAHVSKSVTPKERYVLEQLAEGLSVQTIAGTQQKPVSSTDKQLKRLKSKLGATSDANLVTLAKHHGILPKI